jgi:uncharacterized protein YbjQ (UPF0145 family)
MLVVTTENVTGYRVTKVVGTVFGISVRSRSFIGNILGSWRAAMGGTQSGYAKMVEETRREAILDMMKSAAGIGGNAVVMMRFDSGEFGAGKGQAMNEVVAYGTAVIVEQV